MQRKRTTLGLLLAALLRWMPPDVDPQTLARALNPEQPLDAADELKLLQADARRLFDLSEKMGEEIVGDGSVDFETRLLAMYDDDRFAHALGTFVELSAEIFRNLDTLMDGLPELGSEFGSVRALEHPVALRAQDNLLLLVDQLGGEDAILSAFSGRRAEIIELAVESDPEALGRQLLDSVYDPAATQVLAATHRCLIRLVARLFVVRHLVTSNVIPAVAYVDGLFERSEEDIRYLGGLFAASFGMPLPAGSPLLDLRTERLRYKWNQRLLEDTMSVVEQEPGAWDTIFPDDRRVG